MLLLSFSSWQVSRILAPKYLGKFNFRGKRMKNIGLSLLIIGLLSGCGDANQNKKIEETVEKEAKIDKTASPENFKRVLNDYYARNCILVSHGKFPMEMSTDGFMFGGYEDLLKRTEALEKLGYLTSEKIKKENKHSASKKRFILTEKGKKVYSSEGKNKGICAFTRQIKSIDNYTEPSNMMGVTITRVNFTFEPIKSTDTINEMKKEKALADFIDEVTKKTSSRAELILTGMKGWIHHSEFKRTK